MDWTDPELAFSPDSCNCSVKLYSDKEVDRFLAEVGSRWPAFTFFNQLGNRWIQSRAAAIWPDGRRSLCGELQHHLPGRLRLPAVPL